MSPASRAVSRLRKQYRDVLSHMRQGRHRPRGSAREFAMPHLPCELEQLEQRLLLSAVSFAPEVPYPTGSYSCGAINGDFNDDGMPDLAVVNGDSATLSVLLNNGDGLKTVYAQFADGANNLSAVCSDAILCETLPPQPPAVYGGSPCYDLRPTWQWLPSGGGNGTFRYKLDDPDLSSGAVETTATTFQPSADLPLGTHVLYVQERNDEGMWSALGSLPIEVIPRSMGIEITQVGQWGGEASAVVVAGEYAYLTRGPCLDILSMADPNHPVLMGSMILEAAPRGLAVSGDFAYVADGVGLAIIDVSTKTAPVLLSLFTTGGWPQNVSLVGNVVYVADVVGLTAIDVSTPASPILLGSYQADGWEASNLCISGGLAYLVGWATGLEIIDVTNPADMVLRGSFRDSGIDSWDVCVSGTLAYLADNNGGLILDVSNPAAPMIVGTFPDAGNVQHILVSGNLAYVADYAGGLKMFDIANPESPVLRGCYQTSAPVWSLCVSDNLAYLVGGEGLRVVEVSDPALPVPLGRYATGDVAWDVDVSGDLAFVADGYAGLQILDVSNPSAPALVGVYNDGCYPARVRVTRGLAYVLNNWRFLDIIDVSNPEAPVLLSSFPCGGWDICVSGNFVYLATDDGYIKIIDVTDPAAPVLRGTVQVSEHCYSLCISGNMAYVRTSEGDLQIVDVSNPDLPVPRGRLSIGQTWAIDGLYVSEGSAYCESDSGLVVVNVSNPDAPTLLGSGGGTGRSVWVAGSLAYSGGPGLAITDVSNPACLALVASWYGGSVGTSGNLGLRIRGDVAYIADYTGGLVLLRMRPNPLSDILLSNTTVPADQAAGTAVGTFSTVDVNSGDTFTYDLVGGDGADSNSMFAIDGSVLRTEYPFAFEEGNSYSIRVRSTSQEGHTFEKVFTISVTRPDMIVGRHVFYNNSALDGNDPGANQDDDNAIDAGKQALLPGGTATSANFTNYSRGINGIMVDIQGLASGCTPTANDFIFMITSGGTGSSWALAPSPESISVRAGAGAGGSSRVTIIWPDNAIQGQWLQVIVLSNGGGSLGLAEDDVFCFGNVPGDADGDGAVDAADYVSLKRQFGRSASSGGVTADFDRSGQVDYADLLAVTGSFGQAIGVDMSLAEYCTVDLPSFDDTGVSDTDNLTNNPTPTIEVTVNYPDTQSVGIYVNDQWVGNAYQSQGQWLYGFGGGQLSEGPNSITGRAYNSLGQSVTSPALVIALDTIDPGADVSTNADATFGVDGQVTTPLGSGSSWINAAVMQPDGKIVTAGQAYNGGNLDIAICRYNTDGSLDSGFGSGGTIVGSLSEGHNTAAGLAIQPDDRMIVVALDGGSSKVLARYNDDGTPDTSFGDGGIVRFTDGIGRGFNSVSLQPDGKIVASGWKSVGPEQRTLLCRFNADGSLDTTFGDNGESVGPTGSWYSEYPSLVLLPGGDMLVCASDQAGNKLQQDSILLRYLPDGSLDTSFADNGKLILSPGADREWLGTTKFAVDGDGRILIAGWTMDRPDSGARCEVIVSRYLPDGSIDAGFGEGGIGSIWPGGGGDSVRFLSVLADGRILAAGAYGGPYAFTSDGQPDGRVGVGGICQPNAPGGNSWSTGFVQPDGKVVLAGQRWSANRFDSSLLRLEPPASAYEWASIDLQASSDTGAPDGVTFDDTPTFDIRGGGQYWRIYRDGQLVSDPFCTGPAWTSEPLPDGTYTFRIAMVDAAGNEFFSDDQMVTVGAVPMDLLATSDSGVSDNDNVTSDNTPTFAVYGRTPSLHIYRDGQLVGAVPTIVGQWTSQAISEGDHLFHVVEVDDEGNEVAWSQELHVTILTQKPPTPPPPDLEDFSDTGISNTDNLTADKMPVFNINSTSSFVRVYRKDAPQSDPVLVSDPFKAGYQWRSAELADGTYYFQASSVDAAGNESDLSTPLGVTIQTVPSGPPPAPDLLAGSDSGISHADNITNDQYPAFSIPGGDAGFRVYRDGELVSTPDSWEFGDTWWSQWLGDGTYPFQVSLADAMGNESPLSEPLYVTIDTQAPEVTVDFLTTELQRPPLGGTVSEPVATVRVTVYGASYIGEYDGDGTWSLAAGLLRVPPGASDVAVEASDLAGNVGYDTTTDELFISSTFELHFFEDPNLEAAVCDQLGGVTPEDLTPALLASMGYLDASGRGITNLDGMQFCTGLANLYLYENRIADLAPLGGLANLTWLMIWDNQITDIGPLAGLVNLGWLYIAGNSIQDIGPLGPLTQLRSLGIDYNDISDISALSELTNLESLWLSENPISDLSPLAALENLRELHKRGSPGLDLSTLPALTSLITLDLADSGISDLSPLAKLTALDDLDLSRNGLSDVSGLSGMVGLRRLDLGRNQIVDLWPLAGLTNLEYLDLDHNSVSSLDALWGLTALRELYAWNNDITSLVPLLANTGLGGGGVVGIGGNPLSANALAVQIPALQSRGVRVDLESDPRLDVDYVYISRNFINYDGQPIGSPIYGFGPWMVELEVEGMGLHGVSITTPNGQVIVMQENEDHEWAYRQDFSSRDAMLAVFPSGAYVMSFNNGQDGVAVLLNTPEPTDIPDITFPSAGATDVPWDHPTFTWTSWAGFGQRLWFSLTTGEGPDNLVYEGGGAIDVTSWTLPGALDPGQEYVFAVGVYNEQDPSDKVTALGDRFDCEVRWQYINHIVFTTAEASPILPAMLPAILPADPPVAAQDGDARAAALGALLADASIRAARRPAGAAHDAPEAPAASKSHVAALPATPRGILDGRQARPELADVLGLAQPPWPGRWAATRRLEEPLEIGPDLDVLPSRRGSLPGLDEPDGQIIWLSGV